MGYFNEEGATDATVDRIEFANGTAWAYGDVLAALDADVVPNTAPTVVAGVADASATVNQALAYTLAPDAFADADAGDHLSYTVTNADGTALPAWLTFDPATLTLSGTPTSTAVAGVRDVLNLVVTATDEAGAIAQDTFVLTVAPTGLARTGTSANDTLAGSDGNDSINGLAGADRMIGGWGNDTYVVDHAGDATIENVGEGTDSVFSSVSHTLGANVENLTLTDYYSAITGTGNALANAIVGTNNHNVLNGGAGADTLTGWMGNDTYHVDNAGDLVIEEAGTGYGTDTVVSTVDYTLGANVENLTLAGSAALDGTGNGFNNVLTGNGGANILDGKAGNDTLIGGGGDDTYLIDSAADAVVENADAGTDTVRSSVTTTLAANVENLTLAGAAAINATGNALANALAGNAAANRLDGGLGNDTLDGGLGNDTMAGGLGNDSYVISQFGDLVVENAGEGVDTILAFVSVTASNNVENLALAGTSSINGIGNALDNTILGNAGSNRLDGGAGADSLAGGRGNDTYVVDHINDLVSELAGEGTDTVSSLVSLSLSANLEILQLAGSASLDGTGNDGDNWLKGNAGANTLDGLTGNDLLAGLAGDDVLRDLTGNNLLDGGAGNDLLEGGAGNDLLAGGTGDDLIQAGAGGADIIAFNAGDGLDQVIGSSGQDDTLSLGQVRFADLQLSRSGNDLVLGTGTGEGLLLQGWYLGQQGVATLQVLVADMDYDAGSADVLHNSKVVQFDFAHLVGQFEQQGATGPWTIAPVLGDALVYAGDGAAIGADAAALYGRDGSLGAADMTATLALIGQPGFGVANQDLGLI